MNEAPQRIEELEKQLEERKTEFHGVESELQESRKRVRKDALAKLRSTRSEYNAANIEHEKSVEAKNACHDALRGCVIGEREPHEVHEEIESDIAEALRLRKIAERKNPLWPVICLWIAVIVSAVVGAVFAKSVWWATAVFGALGIIMIPLRKKRISESATADIEHGKILAKYKADDEGMIEACEREFLALHDAFTKAEELEHSTAAYLEQCRLKLEEMESRTLEELDFSGGSGESAELTKLYNEKLQQYQSLEAEIARLKN